MKVRHNKLKWGWMTGWGSDPFVFKHWAEVHWPSYTHYVFSPSEDSLDKISKLTLDQIGGHSLGALLLLHHWKYFEGMSGLFFAPFFSFCAEDGLGGASTKSDLIRMQKVVKKNPQQGLHSFCRLVGMNEEQESPFFHDPSKKRELLWGLKQLQSLQVSLDSSTDLTTLHLVWGDQDPLINSSLLEKHCQVLGVKASLLEGCGHNYRELGEVLLNKNS